jgi:hypothetical protein
MSNLFFFTVPVSLILILLPVLVADRRSRWRQPRARASGGESRRASMVMAHSRAAVAMEV